MAECLRIRLEAYEPAPLDVASKNIVDSAKGSGAKVAGPIPLPTKIERYTVLRSPHVNKKSREQFEVRTHRRLIDVTSINSKTSSAMDKLSLPAGVDIRIKLISE